MIPDMADHGGGADSSGPIRRSPLADYAEPAGADVSHGAPAPSQAEDVARRRREFAAVLGEFRRTAVLVPLDEASVPMTADHGSIRWILAFSNESTLARFAIARGEGDREWAYQRVLGARLLDAGVPAVGVPCGVALDAASGDEGVLFPPVVGIVPDSAAVDVRNGEASR
ncbi:hypothetical protein BEK98_05340 [Streptomyces diastatochromogenes]|uniref:SseB protein N-terminal domain-containing protein n=2 Tax=Streptomyces diastatochromogenes TaxID=42236 RepID=A0A233SRL7_STRDA|nr:hypothetical protein BEK98_05340 [Streptomyces diastatochromogenes]